jgi:PAS domain S-box-containing protein
MFLAGTTGGSGLGRRAPGLAGIDVSLVDHLDVPALVVDRRGRIAAANAAAVAVTGVPRERIRGLHLLELLPDDRRVPSTAEPSRALDGGETLEYASAFARGRRRVATRVVVTPLRLDGAIVGALGIAFELPPDEPSPDPASLPSLTPRQYEVLKLLGEALSTDEIADRLGLARETVRNHVRAVLLALSARSRLEAVVIAERLGLIGRQSSGDRP